MTEMTFFSLVDMVGVLLENRLRRGRFSVRRSEKEARFSKTFWPRMRFGLVAERRGVLFGKHLHKHDVFQFGREERRPFRKTY